MDHQKFLEYKGKSVAIIFSTSTSHFAEKGILKEVENGSITLIERWSGDNVTGYRDHPGPVSVKQTAIVSIGVIEHPFIKERITGSNTTQQRVANLEL